MNQTKRRPKTTATVSPLKPALPVRYRVTIYEESFVKDLVGSFESTTPFMVFHVGELFDPQSLIGSNVDVPQGSCWRITHIVHRVSIEKSHVSHQVGICVTVIPRPK